MSIINVMDALKQTGNKQDIGDGYTIHWCFKERCWIVTDPNGQTVGATESAAEELISEVVDTINL